MRWTLKTDIIALLLVFFGFILVDLAAGIFAPIVINIKQRNFRQITAIVVLLALICFAIYLLRCRKNKNKKLKAEQKQ